MRVRQWRTELSLSQYELVDHERGRSPPNSIPIFTTRWPLGSRIPSFAPRYASAGVLWIQLWQSTHAYGAKRFQWQHATATDAASTSPSGNATMAVNVEQPSTSWIPTNLPATSATYSIHVYQPATHASVSHISSIRSDPTQDSNRQRSKANVPVR